MGVLTCLLLLVAAPEPVRLVAPHFSVSGVPPEAARVWSDFLVRELTRLGISIQTEGDIAAALGGERQRQLLGCGDDSCIGELAGAMGSDGLLLGSVAKADETRVLNLRIVSKLGQPLAVASASVMSDAAVIEALPRLARELVAELRTKVERGRIPDESFRLLRAHSVWPGLVGGLLAGIGTTLVTLASNQERNIRAGGITYANVTALDTAVSSGRSLELGGWLVIGVAAAFVLTAIGIVVFGEGR